MPSSQRGLASSARASILWGAGSTLLRDLVQFVTMLALVRLLTPQDYGSAALAHSIIGLISVVSFGTLVLHALQQRDPGDIDWQAHFTAAVVVNSSLFCITLAIAAALSLSERYGNAGLPLAGLATVFLVEIPGTLRHRMLETQHDWKRFRILLVIGTLLAAVCGLIVAFLGGGVWALVVQVPLLSLPAAIDLFVHRGWRPDWTWSWARYREAVRFGMNRMGAAAAVRTRQTVEQSVLAGAHGFATLGIFTRAVGLATLVAGRIGSVAMMSLYPVVTRAEDRSERFQRISGLVLRGVSWTTIPAALLLALCADQVVALLYGPKWVAVVPLLRLAAAVVALSGIAATTSSLLMANNDAGSALRIDLVSAVFAVALAVWLVPTGIETYLAALVAHGLVVLLITLSALARKRGIASAALLQAFLPAMLAGGGAVVAVEGFRSLVAPLELVGLRLLAEAAVFAGIYLLILRLAFPRALREILDVAPGGRRIAASIMLSEENS